MSQHKVKMPEKKERKIAFVVVDVQRKFTGGNIRMKGNEDKVRSINKVASMFRENDRPVIFILYDGPCMCSSYDKDDADEYLQGIISDPSDIIVHKDRMDSFAGSKLAEVVKECGCDSILLSGMVTQYCVMGTYFGAFEHNISPYLLSDGMISTEEKYNDAARILCKTFDIKDVEENLRTVKTPEAMKMCGSEHQRCDISQ